MSRVNVGAHLGPVEQAVANPATADERLPPAAALRYRLWQSYTARPGDPLATAGQLVGLERDLHRLSRSLEADGADTSGSAVIAGIQRLRELCQRLNLDECAAEAADVTAAFLVRAADRSTGAHLAAECAGPSSAGADLCFDALIELSALELECGLLCPDRAIAPDAFHETRRILRERLLSRLADASPTPAQRSRWVTVLADRASLLLTSLDNVPFAQLAGRLGIVADDIRWHRAHVENRIGWRRRRLRHKLAQLRAEEQERLLRLRLERRFGPRFVYGSERLVLLLIVLVVGLLAVEAFADLSPRAVDTIGLIDLAACVVFLSEFAVRLGFVNGRWLWFRRHFLIDFVPSIPFGFILGHMAGSRAADVVRLGRLARLMRLPLLRGVALLARGFDRLTRQYGHVLNQNVILYPTREELERARRSAFSRRSDLRRFQGELDAAWDQLLAAADEPLRRRIAEIRLRGLAALLDEREAEAFTARMHETHVREIPAGILIDRLAAATPQDVESELGEQLVAQVARSVRLFSRAPLRWLPMIRQLLPRLSEDMADSEIAAAASQRLARVLKRHHDIYFWFADLYGTVTPSQFVDRVGSMLVRSSFRPFYRLVLFGGLFLLTQLAIELTRLEALHPVERFLNRFVGPTLMVLGTVCAFILLAGWWLRRVAREATEFYERAVQAQFLSLTEIIRGRHLRRDAEVLYDRVLRPDWERHDPLPGSSERRTGHIDALHEAFRRSLVDSHIGAGECPGFRGLEGTLLLYRDWLDGGLFTDNDTRATSQLLGNPAVRQFLALSGRVERRQIKRLHVLDLERQKSMFAGPYLWFNFVSQSVAYSVAGLLIDYNRHAIPLDELPAASPAERRKYDQWLRAHDSPGPPARDNDAEAAEQNYLTTAFTALHFLDFDAQRDRDVELRFGTDVLARLVADRSLLIRRIFGTYPMHDRPKEQRVVNLYAFYGKWLAGGRALLAPVYAAALATRFAWTLLVWIGRAVQQVRRPELRRRDRDAARAHFFTAVRKIDRIRGPVVEATLRLRMLMDPEYLGIPLPETPRSSLAGADVESDLAFLDPDPQLIEHVEHERQRALSDMRRLEQLIAGGLFGRVAERLQVPAHVLTTPEHLRAAAVAYVSDYRHVRRHLSAAEILEDVFRAAAAEPLLPRAFWPRPRLHRRFVRSWRRHGSGGARERRAAWRAVRHNVGGVRDALVCRDALGERAEETGERLLGEILVHPGRITEQLVTIRAIQTLTVLDVLNYREHVYALGRYAEMGDQPGDLLIWRTVETTNGSLPTS
ncbi:MAG TPA: hypothetical protein VML55_16075 [Planctomycetaceae bacterium]|nr:hypothetical protein [Planctomycetaceae bacterium]